MRKFSSVSLVAIAGAIGFSPGQVFCGHYPETLMLHGAPVNSKISGFKGTRVTVNVENGEHAMDGISSVERRDQPCSLWIGTENINDPAQDSGATLDRCGGDAGSRSMKVEYLDNMDFGPRVFVTGIRVCTYGKGSRIKGFQLRGRQVQDDGSLAALEYPKGDGGTMTFRLAGGKGEWPFEEQLEDLKRDPYVNDPQTPADYRNNCKDWKAWADCPHRNQVATGVVAHFEAGKKPRAITGLALQCRFISRLYTGSNP